MSGSLLHIDANRRFELQKTNCVEAENLVRNAVDAGFDEKTILQLENEAFHHNFVLRILIEDAKELGILLYNFSDSVFRADGVKKNLRGEIVPYQVAYGIDDWP